MWVWGDVRRVGVGEERVESGEEDAGNVGVGRSGKCRREGEFRTKE